MRGASSAVALFALAVAACSGGVEETEFPAPSGSPDPGLGTLVFEAAVRRAAGTSPVNGLHGIQPNIITAAVDRAGGAHLVFAMRPYRIWGESATQPSEIFYRHVSPDGSVEKRLPPTIGEPFIGRHVYTTSLEGNHLALGFVGALASGQVLVLHAFDGAKWNRFDLLRSDLANRKASPDWEAAKAQLRMLAPTKPLVQHGDRLLRVENGVWVEVPPPAGARTLRLGPADAAGVRLFWFDETATFHSQILDTGTWQLRGEDAVHFAGTTEFADDWGFTGTLDTFQVDLDASRRLRFATGAFRTLEAPTDGQSTGTYATAFHPTRSVRVTGSGEFFGAYLGVGAAPLGTFTATTSGALVAPRYMLMPDATGIVVPVLQHLPDGVRVYVRRAYFPLGASLPEAAPTPRPFPGDTGAVDETVEPTRLLAVSGRAIRFGRTEHAGISVVLEGTGDGNGSHSETVTTDAAGRFRFKPVPAGDFRVTAETHTWTITSADHGAKDVGLAMLGVTPTRLVQFDPDASATRAGPSTLYQQNNGTIVYRDLDTGAATTLTTAATASRLNPEGNRWIAWNEGPALKVYFPDDEASTRARTVSANTPLDWLRPSVQGFFYPDGAPATGQTPRHWRHVRHSHATPVEHYDLVDLWPLAGCTSLLIWRENPYDQVFGGYQYQGCDHSPSPELYGNVPATLPFLTEVRTYPHPNRSTSFIAFGAAATACRDEAPWTNECPLWSSLGPTVTSTAKASDRARYFEPGLGSIFAYVEQRADGAALMLGYLGTTSSQAFATGVTLPTSYLPGERPVFMSDDGGVLYWKDAAGKLWAKPGNSAAQVIVENVRRVVRIQQNPYIQQWLPALLVHTGTGTGSLCAEGCGMFVVQLGQLSATRVLPDGAANGREVPAPNMGWYRDGVAWTDCPVASCSLVVRREQDGSEEPIAIGSLWPDRAAAWVPFEPDLQLMIERSTGSPRTAALRAPFD